MTKRLRQDGFSLTETLLAVGTLAVGMLFIAGTFLTGIRFTELSTKRGVAAVVADEAFMKIRLYGDPNTASLRSDGFVSYEDLRTIPEIEYRYPSTADPNSSPYTWSVICRGMPGSNGLVQCIVFVSRDVGNNSLYQFRDVKGGAPEQSGRPRATLVALETDSNLLDDRVLQRNELLLDDAGADEWRFVNDGARIIDDETGQIYRVLERYADQPDRLKLDRPRAEGPVGGGPERWVWVVPPPASSGRSPLVAVYQKVLKF
jgi:hypothetical protein